MDRRGFLTTAGALSLTAAMGELGAAEHPFDPTEQSIASLQRALAAGAVTSETLTAAYLKRIARFDRHGPQYRSVLALNPNALGDARVLDAERKSGKLRGPLHGIPIIVKDNIETRDPMATTAGSYALAKSFRPADSPHRACRSSRCRGCLSTPETRPASSGVRAILLTAPQSAPARASRNGKRRSPILRAEAPQAAIRGWFRRYYKGIFRNRKTSNVALPLRS